LLAGCSSASVVAHKHPTTSAASETSTATQTPTDPATSTDSGDEIGPADFAAIRHVLSVRARAVVNGNLGAFMATVDQGRPEFLQSQRVMFANLQALPVDSMSYDVGNAGLTNAGGIKGGPLLTPEIVEHVFFKGTDRRPVGNEIDETFVRRGGTWLLAADTTDPSASNGDTARPWAGPAIAVATDGPLIAIMDKDAPGGADALLQTVKSDISFDAGILDVPVDDHIVVDATTGGSVMKFDNKESAGAVTFGVDAIRNFELSGLAGYRIKVNPSIIQYLDQDPTLLRHELTHYLMYKYTGVNPKWLSEGLAEYVSHQPLGLSSEFMTTESYDRLMRRPHELTVSGLYGQDPSTDYPLAMACVTYLVDHGGMSKLKQLMQTYADYPYAPYEDSHTRQALEKVYGFGPETVANGAFALLAALR
jgi:hypothetical protein